MEPVNLTSKTELPNYSELIRLDPGEESRYAKIMGAIPNEESDEEFAKAVDELS
jgi:hypothetical protein